MRVKIKDGVEVSIMSNGAILFLTSESDPNYEVNKLLTIGEALGLAQILISAAMSDKKMGNLPNFKEV